ncbi:MAG: DNA polymerase III [Betaproteobacteria bacterium HGW-Betaproteobacteria-10]|nr:MAG: DNA polymerase III [Betaproteobacteria bacterium HGW-Betaproteobacteria-10]
MSLSREQMLVEMGISPIWVQREPGVWVNAQVEAPPHPLPTAVAVTEQAPVLSGESASLAPIKAPVTRARPVLPQEPFSPNAAAKEIKTASTRPETTAVATVDRLNWPELSKQAAACKACALCEQRKQAVLGVGDLNPDWLFIGEGPGTEEDTQGEPFVGPAGKLLDNMLAALDISRGHRAYLTNAVNCRPPGNRPPEAAEIAACRPYVERQIALLKPKIIVLLGKAAMHSVLHGDKKIADMRGTRFEYAGIPVVVTYHPAYLLRNLPDKIKAWEDLLFARRLLRAQDSAELPF